MHLWIVTIGSSDVQLISDRENQARGRTEQQRSDKVWSYWYTDDLRADCYDISFEPKQNFKDKGESYKIAPRILGRVYQASGESRQKEIWDYLTFPLLDNFVQALAEYPTPESIAVILTDQSTIFESDRQRQPNSPYWQDTCELQPILQKYFTEKFPNAPCEFISLIPTSEAESLDNWNAVLDLVRGKFRSLEIANQQVQITPEENVYVSHQAGTPAISSAVQFCSLAKFGDRVKFLVSNEYKHELTGFVESSSYLRGIQIEQAKKLLDQHDYSGVRQLIGSYLDAQSRMLIDAAITWNFVKFADFANILEQLTDPRFESLVQQVKERRQHWWWTAYESAYLALIRFEKQKDTVDAFFHSYRAIEGAFTEWGIDHFKSHIQVRDGRPYLQTTILNESQYFNRAKYKKDGKPDNDIAKLKHRLEEEKEKGKDIVFYGDTIYTLFREVKQDWKSQCESIKQFWDSNKGIAEKRNKVFHQLQGLTDEELFKIWEVNGLEDWKTKMCQFINFISNQSFHSLDKEDREEGIASLMVKVHQELVEAIAQL